MVGMPLSLPSPVLTLTHKNKNFATDLSNDPAVQLVLAVVPCTKCTPSSTASDPRLDGMMAGTSDLIQLCIAT